MPKIKVLSHLRFSRSEQGGIFLLSVVIVGLLIAYFFVEVATETVFDITSSEIVQQQQYLDSLYAVEVEARKPKLYPFNPNFITDHKAYSLNMPTEAYDKLKQFRKKDQWINSIAQFQKVTGVSDVWLDSIGAYFKFPEWVTNSKPKKKYFNSSFRSKKSNQDKLDLNMATAEVLTQVSGIGEILAKRIVAYRETLGGFTNAVQLYEVYGLSPEVVKRTKELFIVKTPNTIEKYNVNTATASDLATIPGVSFTLGKRIWEFVRLREGIRSLSELEKIEGISTSKLERIQLYLSVD